MQPYILVMEDEDALATLLQYNLEKEGYDVAVAAAVVVGDDDVSEPVFHQLLHGVLHLVRERRGGG